MWQNVVFRKCLEDIFRVAYLVICILYLSLLINNFLGIFDKHEKLMQHRENVTQARHIACMHLSP